MTTHARGVSPDRVSKLAEAEHRLFAARNPRSKALAERTKAHWLNGVPMLWMTDWGTPFPLFVAAASGNRFTDADGHDHVDFCLGDTGAMFGHSPPQVAEAMKAQAERGLTTMLPSEDAAIVGELLARRFGLPYWQVTTSASDANRSIIRWARGITGRPKVLVVNGCYHGAVDDAFVSLANGRARNRPGLVGEVRDLTATSKVVEFNDVPALQAALEGGDIALVLIEPVMTNCGMVLPDPGYHDAVRALTRKHGTLLAIDETHTISSGPAGYTGTHRLEPDFFVLGKPISGGIPSAVYGFTEEVSERIAAHNRTREPGYGGIGTTLSGNALQLAAMRVVLEEILTDEVYERAMPHAEALQHGLEALIAHHGLPWHVARVGLRVEFVCAAERPRNGTEAGLVAHNAIERALHVYCLNRGVAITPFHNMMLVCPATGAPDVAALVAALDGGMAELTGVSPMTAR
ncbi:MAG: aspartate aminotransferase family protein [Hyphomicrobiaceae bacterium]